MIEIHAFSIIAATFLLAGTVKGVIGLGLPTVSLALLTTTLGLEPAMAMMLAPSLVTNLWQALTGGHGRTIWARLWPFLAAATATVWAGAALATWTGAELGSAVNVALLSALLGAVLVLYAATGLGRELARAPRVLHQEPAWWAGLLAGCANGLLTGMTGSFVMPGVPYLQALGLPRDMLIQAMGILFTLSTAALALTLAGRGLLNAGLGLQSVAAIAPALLGMVLGRWLRQRLPETVFRRIFFVALLGLGLYIVTRSLGPII